MGSETVAERVSNSRWCVIVPVDRLGLLIAVCFGGEGEVETSRAGKSTSCRLLHFINRSLLTSADAGSIHTTSNEEASGGLGQPTGAFFRFGPRSLSL